MNENNLTSAVLDYANAPQTDYAILIDGPWGAGKTFYFTKTLEPLLRKSGLKPIYLSLNGIKSSDEASGLLLAKISPELLEAKTGNSAPKVPDTYKKYLRVAFSAIFEKFNSSGFFTAAVQDASKNTPNLIFCFDDLERAKDIDAALTFVSSILENENQKIIIIGAEKEINSVNYKTRKEKAIGYTLSFEADIHKVLDDIISLAKNTTTQQHLRNNVQTIFDLHQAPDNVNLRSLKHGIRLYTRMFEVLMERGVNVDEIGTTLLKLIIGITSEARKNEDNKAKLSKLSAPDFSEVALHMRLNKNKDAPEDIYLRDFLARFQDSTAYSPIYKTAYKYAFEGYLDMDGLVEDANYHLETLKPKVASSEKAFLGDYREMTNEEFSQQAEMYIENLKNFEIKELSKIYQVANRLYYFATETIIAHTPTEIISLVEQTLLQLEKTNELVITNFSPNDIGSVYGAPIDDTFRSFLGSVTEIYERTLQRVHKESINEIFALASVDPDKFLVALQEGLIEENPTQARFQYCDPVALASAIKKFSNAQLLKFLRFIGSRYGFANLQDFFKPEQKAIERISKELMAGPEIEAKALSSIGLKAIARRLQQISNSLKE